MKDLFLLSALAAGSILAVGRGSASANDWVATEVFELGSVTLSGGESAQFDLLLKDNPMEVIGFKFEFDYFEPMPDASFASNLRLEIMSPLGNSFIVGGFDNIGDADDLWGFTGPDSGNYMDEFFPWKFKPQPKGDWTLGLTNDWSADPFPNEYNNMIITFYKIPAPGTLVLLALGGLIGRRRRR